jgi:hypothetical protein
MSGAVLTTKQLKEPATVPARLGARHVSVRLLLATETRKNSEKVGSWPEGWHCMSRRPVHVCA